MKIYHRLIKNIFTVVVVILLFFLELPFTQASEISEGVKKTLDSIIGIVSREDLKNNEKKAERRALLREIVSKKFSYYEMSRRSLAKHWKERTAEEKKEFADLFGKLLENSYANKIESYSDEKIIYVDEKKKGNVALVKTIVQKSNDEITVNYKLVKLDNDWKIYDLIVEGVSMIKNYRTQFKMIIHKSSYEELVSKLKKKLETI
jgi:phospholipid transport system substrate-binding protein